MTGTAQPLYLRRERMPFRKLDQQTVIINPQSREVHVLNDTGSAIWEMLADARSVPELVTALMASDYEGPPAEMREDVSAFVGDLERKGLVGLVPVAEGRGD